MIDERSDDSELVVAASEGDDDAFATLVRRHQAIAHRVAYLVSGSASEADDVTQDAFVKAYTKLDRFRPGSPFRPWLLSIVGNEARNRRRAGGRRVRYENEVRYQADAITHRAQPERDAIASSVHQTLLEAVNSLPERERVVVGLRYFVELTEAETARVLRIPRGTVKSRLSRALGRLRTEMEATDE